MKINNDLVFLATKCKFLQEFEFDGIGLLATSGSNNRILSFIESKKYISSVNNNGSISGIFCTQELADAHLIRSDIELIIVDDPKWFFFSIVDYLGKNRKREKTNIADSARIHAGAYISPLGVIIGENCVIEPNVTIMQDVVIGDNVIVRAGAVIGVDGYEHKKTSRGILSVTHNGHVFIGNNVEIGVNTNIAKGFSYQSTIIGEGTKIDALVHYAHGVKCGKDCLIAANAMIAGNVDIGNRVWIGPSATISNRVTLQDDCFITLGSVVIGNVSQGEKMSGNFAIPHRRFLKNMARMNKND